MCCISVKWHRRLETETYPMGCRMDMYLGHFQTCTRLICEDLIQCCTIEDFRRVVESVHQLRHVGARISSESCDIFESLIGKVATEIQTLPAFPDAYAMREICDRYFVGEQHTVLPWWSSSVLKMRWPAVETKAKLAEEMLPRLKELGRMDLVPRTLGVYADSDDYHRELLAFPKQNCLRVSVTCEAKVDSTESRLLSRAPFLVWEEGEPPSADTLMEDILKEAWSINKEILERVEEQRRSKQAKRIQSLWRGHRVRASLMSSSSSFKKRRLEEPIN